MKGLQSGWLHIVTLVIFLERHGLGAGDIFLLKAYLSLVTLLIELPTGIFADRYGRKLSLLIGGAASFTALATYACAESFSGFLAAELVLGVGTSFISGADSALLYDSLADSHEETE